MLTINIYLGNTVPVSKGIKRHTVVHNILLLYYNQDYYHQFLSNMRMLDEQIRHN